MKYEVNLSVTLNGTAEELYNMLLVVKKYSDLNSDTDAHFEYTRLKNDSPSVLIDTLNDEKLREYAKNSQNGIKVKAAGPYDYDPYKLNDIYFFRLLSEVAPGAAFDGILYANGTYDEQSWSYRLANGKLDISIFYQSNEDAGEMYAKYVAKHLTLRKFRSWFKIDLEDLEKEDYLKLIESAAAYYELGLDEMGYDDWIALLDEFDIPSSLEEDDFDTVYEKIEALELNSFELMQAAGAFGTRKQLVYDPIDKKYL